MNQLLANLIAIGAGSAIGGMARYLVGRAVQAQWHGSFPLGTFIVNVAGCFIIGLIYGLIDRGFNLPESARLFLTVGLCGGFTTFSTFINENYLLISSQGQAMALLYAVASIAVGFLMLYLAYFSTRSL